VIDLPPVAALAGEIIASLGASDVATGVRPGNYLDCDMPADQDVVLISRLPSRARSDLS
jgi:hypothetical protein